MSPRRMLVVLAVLAVPGCGPVVETNEDGSSTGSSSSSAGEATSDVPVTATTTGSTGSTGTSGLDGPSSTTSDDGGYEEDDGGTGCTFTCPNPPPPTPPPGGGGGGGSSACDLDAQDCPEGEKCMPWANDGGSEWNATRCYPIDDDPGQPGDPCVVDGGPWSGIDDCDLGGICWQVDVATNQGVCHPLCMFDGAQYVCEGSLACSEVEFVPLCIQPCDPLDPASCPQASACAFFMGTALVCQPSLGGAMAGMQCDAATVCEAGTLCAYDAALDCGNGVGQGCCAAPCDLGDPVACADPEVCLPWFPLLPPPELAWLGFCAAP